VTITELLKLPNETPSRYEQMPPHLDGYWWVTEHIICIPFIETDSRGSFKKFMIKLERQHKIIFFPTIISARLQDICERNGYIPASVIDEEMGFVDGMAKDCKEPQAGAKE